MEIEVKLKLSGPEAHDLLSFSSTVLRLRFYDGDQKCVVTYKGDAVIESGISGGEELEEEIDVNRGWDYVAYPKRVATFSYHLLKIVASNFGATDYICLGGFRRWDYVAYPKRIATSSCHLLKTLASNFGATDYICLGGFRNIQNVYS